jgi:hypothetical protein
MENNCFPRTLRSKMHFNCNLELKGGFSPIKTLEKKQHAVQHINVIKNSFVKKNSYCPYCFPPILIFYNFHDTYYYFSST